MSPGVFVKMRLVNTQVLTESTAVNRSNFQGKWEGVGGGDFNLDKLLFMDISGYSFILLINNNNLSQK